MTNFFKKMKGTTKSPPVVRLSEIIWSWIGAFLGIASVALINFNEIHAYKLKSFKGGEINLKLIYFINCNNYSIVTPEIKLHCSFFLPKPRQARGSLTATALF